MAVKKSKRTYSGKYPTRIREVYGMSNGIALAVLNNGDKHTITAKSTGGRFPQLGKEIAEYTSTKVEE